MRETEKGKTISCFGTCFFLKWAWGLKCHKQPLPAARSDFKLLPVWGVMGAEKSLLNMGVIVPSFFFSNLPSSENVPPFFLCPLTSPNPHPSISHLSSDSPSLIGRRPNNRDGSSLIISHPREKKKKKRLMEKFGHCVDVGGGKCVF